MCAPDEEGAYSMSLRDSLRPREYPLDALVRGHRISREGSGAISATHTNTHLLSCSLEPQNQDTSEARTCTLDIPYRTQPLYSSSTSSRHDKKRENRPKNGGHRETVKFHSLLLLLEASQKNSHARETEKNAKASGATRRYTVV